MSIIVAIHVDQNLYGMCSDTLASNERSCIPTRGVQKTVALTPQCFLGFTGSSAWCSRALDWADNCWSDIEQQGCEGFEPEMNIDWEDDFYVDTHRMLLDLWAYQVNRPRSKKEHEEARLRFKCLVVSSSGIWQLTGDGTIQKLDGVGFHAIGGGAATALGSLETRHVMGPPYFANDKKTMQNILKNTICITNKYCIRTEGVSEPLVHWGGEE